MSTTIFETGATTHAVNELILFTDNTAKLAELRDRAYYRSITDGYCIPEHFYGLFTAAINAYKRERPNDCDHIKNMAFTQRGEYLRLYVDDFETWKKEHNL